MCLNCKQMLVFLPLLVINGHFHLLTWEAYNILFTLLLESVRLEKQRSGLIKMD